ncbi:MAG: segregation and condensation protein A [Gammaproteobacteria bacterium]|nr:segregation and condensation protein A [Gammaproteobacteria bacterium]
MMKRVLTDVAKDTHTPPGMKHVLSPNTVEGIRECLGLITAREAELANETGRAKADRPHFVDEPKRSQVVKLHTVKRKPDATSKDD